MLWSCVRCKKTLRVRSEKSQKIEGRSRRSSRERRDNLNQAREMRPSVQILVGQNTGSPTCRKYASARCPGASLKATRTMMGLSLQSVRRRTKRRRPAMRHFAKIFRPSQPRVLHRRPLLPRTTSLMTTQVRSTNIRMTTTLQQKRLRKPCSLHHRALRSHHCNAVHRNRPICPAVFVCRRLSRDRLNT